MPSRGFAGHRLSDSRLDHWKARCVPRPRNTPPIASPRFRAAARIARWGDSSDNDRGGSNDGKCSVRPGVDATSRQSCATSERANSTLLTPLRAQYHKYAVAGTAAVIPNSIAFDRPVVIRLAAHVGRANTGRQGRGPVAGGIRTRSAYFEVPPNGVLRQPTRQPASEMYPRPQWPCYAFQRRPVGRRFEPEAMSPERVFAVAGLPCTPILNESTIAAGRHTYKAEAWMERPAVGRANTGRRVRGRGPVGLATIGCFEEQACQIRI
jgi:hypothetical protein